MDADTVSAAIVRTGLHQAKGCDILERMIGYWHTRELPDDIVPSVESWREYGPPEIVIYDQDKALAFIERHYGPRERDAFLSCAIPAMRSDLFRVLEILVNGGFYLDLSIKLLARPEPFLRPEGNLVLYRRWHGRIVNNMFACAPANPILERIADCILTNIEERISNNVWAVTGPKVWNVITETGTIDGIVAIDHADLQGEVCVFSQHFKHKKDGRHWSAQQKQQSIFQDPEK